MAEHRRVVEGAAPVAGSAPTRGRIRDAISVLETAMTNMWPTPSEAEAKRRKTKSRSTSRSESENSYQVIDSGFSGPRRISFPGYDIVPPLTAELRAERHRREEELIADALRKDEAKNKAMEEIARLTAEVEDELKKKEFERAVGQPLTLGAKQRHVSEAASDASEGPSSTSCKPRLVDEQLAQWEQDWAQGFSTTSEMEKVVREQELIEKFGTTALEAIPAHCMSKQNRARLAKIIRPRQPPPAAPSSKEMGPRIEREKSPKPKPKTVIDDILRKASKVPPKDADEYDVLVNPDYVPLHTVNGVGRPRKLPKISDNPMYGEFVKARSVRFYECFDYQQRMASLRTVLMNMEARPMSHKFLGLTADLVRQANALHHATLNWHTSKYRMMEKMGFECLEPPQRRRLIEYEHVKLLQALDDQADRAFLRAGADNISLSMQDAFEEFRFNQDNDAMTFIWEVIENNTRYPPKEYKPFTLPYYS
jgi:hypothetical protein